MTTTSARTQLRNDAFASSPRVFANNVVGKLVLVVVVLITPPTERDQCLT
jgi:hypothetical protein